MGDILKFPGRQVERKRSSEIQDPQLLELQGLVAEVIGDVRAGEGDEEGGATYWADFLAERQTMKQGGQMAA